MNTIKHFLLPENTNDLYKKEARSSIALTKEVADKINEIVIIDGKYHLREKPKKKVPLKNKIMLSIR